MNASRRGFTLAELLVTLAISGVIGTAVVKLLMTQVRGYGGQLSVGDAGETLRGASALLSWEIRHSAMAADSIASLSVDTLSVRSVQGVGILCAKSATAPMFGIWKNGGDIDDTADDSALVSAGTSTAGIKSWKTLKIVQVGSPATMGMPLCAWSGSRAPDLVVQVAVTSPGDTSGIKVGSIFRNFRRTVFAAYLESGRWWLGRRVGAGAWDKVTGPFLAPTSGGLKFAYYDSTGAATASRASLRVVGIALKAQSYRPAPAGAVSRYRIDSLATRVLVRR